MICPFCLHEKTSVYNSRHTKRLNVTWRRRRCLDCKAEFTTHETVSVGKILKVSDGNNKVVDFSGARLLVSILKVCDHRDDHGEVAFMLADAIEQKLLKSSGKGDLKITKSDIIAICGETLKNFDASAYVKYLTYHMPMIDMKTLKKKLGRAR